MNANQTSKLASYKLIVKEARENATSVNLIKSFADGITNLESICTAIDSARALQETSRGGISDDKNALCDELVELLVEIAGAVHSYALAKNDLTSVSKVDYKEWVLEKMSDSQLIAAATIITGEATKIAASELADQGIAPEELAGCLSTFEKFRTAVSNPRSGIIDRSGHTQKLRDLFAEAAHIKKNVLDRLAPQFKRKAPDFYQKYKAAGIVIIRKNGKPTFGGDTPAENPNS